MKILDLIIYGVALISLILLFYYLEYTLKKNEEYKFIKNDLDIATYALKSFKPSEIQDLSDEEFQKVVDDIILAKFPEKEVADDKRENFNTFNTRYWPHYYYSFPYNYKYGTPWPAGLFSRMYYWNPGFGTGTGWMYYIRPGNDYHPDRWPRNRWIRNNGNYYYLSNRGDYAKNAANYNYINYTNWN